TLRVALDLKIRGMEIYKTDFENAALQNFIVSSGPHVGEAGGITPRRADMLAIPAPTPCSTPTPVLKILSITHPANNTIHLQCLGVPSAVNRVESSVNPSSNSFTTLTSITANGSGAFSFDDTSAGTKKFYRLAYP